MIAADVGTSESDSHDVLLHDLRDGVRHVLDGTVVLQPSACGVDLAVKLGLGDGCRSGDDESPMVSSLEFVLVTGHVLVGDEGLLRRVVVVSVAGLDAVCIRVHGVEGNGVILDVPASWDVLQLVMHGGRCLLFPVASS